MDKIKFRFAEGSDAAGIADIYGYYVNNTAISFECETPSAEDFRHRISETMPRYPFIVCETDGNIAGYACAHSYRSFAAYAWGAELSIYLDKRYHGTGLGKALYGALIELLKMMNFQTVYGIVAYPNPESDRLHKSMGFRYSGSMQKAGFKLGKWYDITNYELAIGDYPQQLEATLPVTSLDPKEIEKVFSNYSSKVKIN